MSLVKSVCAACHTVTERLAVVMDPFMDQSYGICEECLAPLHVRMWESLRDTLGLQAAPKQDGEESKAAEGTAQSTS